MPVGFLVEVPVLLTYVLGLVLLRPRLRSKVFRRAYVALGVVLLILVLVQAAAFVYLWFNPIEIKLNFG